MTELTTCQSKDLLVAYLYDEATMEEHRAAETHLAECADCRAEIEALTAVRGSLALWDAPVLPNHFRVVLDTEANRPAWRRWRMAAPLAAAAVLVLAAAAGLANLEIRYDAEGFVVRTGRSHDVSAPASRAPQNTSAVQKADPGFAPWRAELVGLEQQLRQEFGGARSTGRRPALTSGAAPAAPGSGRSNDEEVLRRVQQLIDESEVRQQRNLALRMTEVSRDFSLQRQSDLVQIQQGFGRLEGRTEAEAARAREMMNYIMQVSQEQPPK